MAKDPVIVVDGANVAYEEKTDAGKPRVGNLVAVRRTLEGEGFDPIIIVDASLHHKVDDPAQLDALIDRKEIRQAPAGTDADSFVLEVAEQYGAPIVSNDRFERYRDRYPWIEDRRVPLMIIRGEVQLSGPDLERVRSSATGGGG